MELKCVKLPKSGLNYAASPYVYINENTNEKLEEPRYLLINYKRCYSVRIDDRIDDNAIAMNKIFRCESESSIDQYVMAKSVYLDKPVNAKKAKFELNFLNPKAYTKECVDINALIKHIPKLLLEKEQKFTMFLNDYVFVLKVIDIKSKMPSCDTVFKITEDTKISIVIAENAPIITTKDNKKELSVEDLIKENNKMLKEFLILKKENNKMLKELLLILKK